jgi:hypothetical protein
MLPEGFPDARIPRTCSCKPGDSRLGIQGAIFRFLNLLRRRLVDEFLFTARLSYRLIRRVVNEESMREHRALRGEVFLYIGLVPKDHDCLQSVALVCRERCSSGASRHQLEARNKYRTAAKHTLFNANMCSSSHFDPFLLARTQLKLNARRSPAHPNENEYNSSCLDSHRQSPSQKGQHSVPVF